MNITPIEKKRMYTRYLEYCSNMKEPDTDFLIDDDTNGLIREMTREEFYEALNYSRKDLYVRHFGSDVDTLIKDSYNRLILVFKVDITNVPSDTIHDYMRNVMDSVKPDDELYLSYFIPVRGESSNVECINPKIIDNDEYMNKVHSILEKVESDFLNSIKISKK